MDKKNLLLSQLSDHSFFYEPKPNTVREDTVEWLPEIKKQYINTDTIHSKTDFTVQKPVQTFRIMTLGDSFTYGLYVNTDENWSEELYRLFNNRLLCPPYTRFEVINLGFPGYDIQQASYRYAVRGQKYNPDLIIWLLKDDDFTQFAEISNKFASEQTKTKKYKSKTQEVYDYIKYLQLSETYLAKGYSHKDIEEIQNKFFLDFSSIYTGPLILINLPYATKKHDNHMKQWATNRDHTFFLNDFSDIQAADLYPDGHPNESGHQKIANRLYTFITEQVLTSCSKTDDVNNKMHIHSIDYR